MATPYSFQFLWHDRSRFLPAVLAVAFSALLIAVQCGVLMGTLSFTSIPIDHCSADVWVADFDVPSIELGYPIPESWQLRLDAQPEVQRSEVYLHNFGYWHKPSGGSLSCLVIGSQLSEGSAGAVWNLTPEMRVRLTEPGSIVVDESDLDRLGIRGVGSTAEISGRQVRVVGLVKGCRGIWGPFIFCSLQTAREILPIIQRGQVQYLLAHCRSLEDARTLTERLRTRYGDMSAFTSEDFSMRTRIYWLTQTRIGLAMGCTAVLGLIVGLVITSQTLYAATAASLREYAVLCALGIPRWRLVFMVLAQSFWIGVLGVLVALPGDLILRQLGSRVGLRIFLPPWLLVATVVVTMVIALVSGVMSLRSLRHIEPAVLLR